MFGFFDKDICPIGIDVGNHSVRFLQFQRRRGQVALHAAAHVEFAPADLALAPGERLIEAFRRGLSAGRFAGKNAVLSLPPATIQAKSIRLPQMPDSDLAQALQWEAKDRFGFDIADGRIAWFRAGEVRRGTEVKDELLLFAVPGPALTLHLDAAAAAGLTIAAIDLPACALFRGAQHGVPSLGSAPAVALLDIGEDGSQFIILRNDQLVFYKYIEIGGNTINDAVAAKLGITPLEAVQMRARLDAAASPGEEAAPLAQALQDAMRPTLEDLARELDMCMRYFVVTFRGARPELIGLTGSQAACPRLQNGLAAGLGLAAEAAQPLRGVLDLGDFARPDRSSQWTLAAGLSLYPVHAGALEAAA